jgi:hypothetical protein
VLNEHIESITFCELNNEDEGKVTSLDERICGDLRFYYACYLTTLSNTKLYGVTCYATRRYKTSSLLNNATKTNSKRIYSVTGKVCYGLTANYSQLFIPGIYKTNITNFIKSLV